MPLPIDLVLKKFVDTDTKITIAFRNGVNYTGFLKRDADLPDVYKLKVNITIMDMPDKNGQPTRREVDFYFDAEAVGWVSPLPSDLPTQPEAPVGALSADELARLGLSS